MKPETTSARDRWCLLALALVALPLFAGPLLRGEVLYRRDLSLVWLPQVEAFVHAVASGSLPLWNPWAGFGQPMLADPRVQAAYPPQWLNLLLRPGLFLTVSVAAHLWLAGAGLFVWLRRGGVSPLAATTAAAAWQASGPLLSFVNFGGHHFAAAAWMPWVLGELDRCLDRPTRRAAARLGLALALQVLAGSPDVVMLTALAGLPIAATRLSRERLRVLALAALLGAALSAVQWMPTVELVARTGRARLAGAEQVLWSLTPGRLVEVVFPLWWNGLRLQPDVLRAVLEGGEPFVLSIYLGAPLLALAAIGLVGAPRRVVVAFSALAVLPLLLALGSHAPLHGLLAATTPLGFMRYPSKALVVVALGVALAAGFGLDRLRRASLAVRMVPFGFALAAGLVVRIVVMRVEWWGPRVLQPERGPGEWAAQVATLVGALDPTLGALAIALAASVLAARPAALAVLGLVVVADLVVRHDDLNLSAPAALYARRPAALDLLPPGARIYVEDYSAPSPEHRGLRHYEVARAPAGWDLPAASALGVQEYLNPPLAARWQLHSSYEQDLVGFQDPAEARLGRAFREADGAGRLRLLQVAGVDAVVSLRPLPWGLLPATEVPGFFREAIRVARVPQPAPRIALVTGTVPASGVEATVGALLGPAFDPARAVVVDAADALPGGAAAGGSLRVVAERADRLEVEVEAPGESHLVVLGTWDPGWRAEVDGQPQPVRRANAMFRAVRVPGGRHHVVMSYRPVAAVAGAAASLAGLLLLVFLGCRPGAAGEGG